MRARVPMVCDHCDTERSRLVECPVCPRGTCAVCERCADRMTAEAPPEAETDPPVLCALCDGECRPEDRLPWLTDTERRHVHADCALRLTRALGYERSATLIARRGPAFRGRS